MKPEMTNELLGKVSDASKDVRRILRDVKKSDDVDPAVVSATKAMFTPILGKPGKDSWDVEYDGQILKVLTFKDGNRTVKWSSDGERDVKIESVLQEVERLANVKVADQDLSHLPASFNKCMNKSLAEILSSAAELKNIYLTLEGQQFNEERSKEQRARIEEQIANHKGNVTRSLTGAGIIMCVAVAISIALGIGLGITCGVGAPAFVVAGLAVDAMIVGGIAGAGIGAAVGALWGFFANAKSGDREPLIKTTHNRSIEDLQGDLASKNAELENLNARKTQSNKSFEGRVGKSIDKIAPERD